MSGILNSGKLATLLTRLTAARAAFLDAAITSRASATDYTTARAAKLDFLDAAISSIGDAPPTTNGLKGRWDTAQTPPAAAPTGAQILQGAYMSAFADVSSSTYDLWTTLLNVTASSGVITWCSVYTNTNTSNLNTQARLSIDGNVVYTSSTTAWTGGDDGDVLCLAGGWGIESIPFSDSFLLEFKITENSAGTVDMRHRTRYHITG